MFKNYLTIALRNLLKRKLLSGITIFGLAAAFTASIMIYIFARHELTYDAFHENAESIYLVYKERITPTGTQITRDTWLPMASALAEDYPVVINTVRTWEGQSWVEANGRRFQETVDYADPALFEMFSFPLASGDARSAFSDLGSVVVSKAIARKYFGETNAIGQRITVDYTTEYIVRGVLEDVPQNSTLDLDIVAPAESVPGYEDIQDNWGDSFLFTFVQLSGDAAPASLEKQFPGFITKIWNQNLNQSMNLKLLPLPDLYNDLTNANFYAYILLGVAGIILLIACLNFMNLTLAGSLERAREIGMRKTLGAPRVQLMKQFLLESLVMALLALTIGIGLLELFLPVFNGLYEMTLTVDYFGNPGNLLALLTLALAVGLSAGAYPAIVLSGYQPVRSLRSKIKSTRSGLRLRHGMVIAQFSLALIMMIATSVMWRQLQFMKQADLNFDREYIAALTLRSSDFPDQETAQVRLETFKNTLRQYSDILSVCSSTHIPGRWPGWFTFAYPTDRDESRRLRVRRAFVDANYFETYGMQLVEGRNFSEAMTTDAGQSLIVNEAVLRAIGWPSGDGRQIRVGGAVYNIIGVVRDYHFQSLASRVAPILHFYRPPDNGVHRVVSARLSAGDLEAALAFIRGKWQELDSGREFDYFFVDENFDRLYASENRLTAAAGAFSVLAIIIACLGLFGLSSLMAAQRTREIGVRKVLGATVTNVTALLSKNFVMLVLLANLPAWPLAWFAMNKWLDNFAYRIEIGWWIFALSGGLALVIALLTVSTQAIRAALANPVESLRYE